MRFFKLPGFKGKAVAKLQNTDTPAVEGPKKVFREYPPGKMPALTVEQHLRRACEHEQMHRDMGISTQPARLYTPGESAPVDAAIMFLRIQTNPATTWWDLVRMFLDMRSPASAKIALDHTAKAAGKKRKEPKASSRSWLKGLGSIAWKRA
jgi:hypothetical protein